MFPKPSAITARPQYLIGCSGGEGSPRVGCIPAENFITDPTPEHDILQDRAVPLNPDSGAPFIPPSERLQSQWQSIYFLSRPDFRSDTSPPAIRPLRRLPSVTSYPIRLYPQILRALHTNPSMQLIELIHTSPDGEAHPHVAFVFALKNLPHHLRLVVPWVSITLGVCGTVSGHPRTHWARVTAASPPSCHERVQLPSVVASQYTVGPRPLHVSFEPKGRSADVSEFVRHSCKDDHVNLWPRLEKRFELTLEEPSRTLLVTRPFWDPLYRRRVTVNLTFAPFPSMGHEENVLLLEHLSFEVENPHLRT